MGGNRSACKGLPLVRPQDLDYCTRKARDASFVPFHTVSRERRLIAMGSSLTDDPEGQAVETANGDQSSYWFPIDGGQCEWRFKDAGVSQNRQPLGNVVSTNRKRDERLAISPGTGTNKTQRHENDTASHFASHELP